MSRRRRGKGGNKGRRTPEARRKARRHARKRIENIRKKPGKPTPAQQKKIDKLKATIQANRGPSRKPQPSPKPSPKPNNRPRNVGRGSFVSNKGRTLTTAQVAQGNRPKATYNPGKRFTQSDVRQMRAGGMNRSQIQNAINNFSGPVNKNVRNRFNVQPTVTPGRGPLAPGATAASSAFSTNIPKATFGVNSRGAKPIDQGGSIPSVMSNKYSGNSPSNFNHGDKFTKKDVRAMNDMGFTLEQKKDYIRKNNLAGTKQGERIISQSRGEFDKTGQYDYGLQFGKGDIRRLRQAGRTNEQISNYINQQGIDNKVATRFLKRNPAQTPSDVGAQVTPPSTTPNTTIPNTTTDPNAETNNPEFTVDPNQNLDPNPDPNSTDTSSTLPDLEGYTRNEDIQDMFDQYIKDAGLVPQNNADPADLEVPEIEETAPYMENIPTPKTTTESADPTWSTTGTGFTSSTMYPGGATNPWSFTPAFQPQPFTTQPVVKPETSTADTTQQPVAKTGSKEQAKEGTFDSSSYSKETSQVGPNIVTANDFVKSGSPKIQPINPFTGLGYTLGIDGLPAYPNQIYGTGTALPGQLTPTGPVEGGYQPNVPAAPTPPTTPYHNQYAKDGLGYLPGQAGNPDGSFGLGIRPLTLKKENGQYVPMPLVAG